MRFEQSIDIDARQQRVWDVLTDLEAWPQRIETVDAVELLTPGPVDIGTRVRLEQPKLPEGTWEVTVWDAPSYFEWRQQSSGVAIVAGHRVAPLEDGRSRLTLTIEMRGLLVLIVGLFWKGLTNRYMTLEAQGMKRAAESGPDRPVGDEGPDVPAPHPSPAEGDGDGEGMPRPPRPSKAEGER